jgi:hypothetical protein
LHVRLRHGAKWSTLYTEIPKAESTGRFEIRPDSMVIKINHDNSGKVTGVVYADKTGTLQEQKARVVCVAGNSVETPRLLTMPTTKPRLQGRNGGLPRAAAIPQHSQHGRLPPERKTALQQVRPDPRSRQSVYSMKLS